MTEFLSIQCSEVLVNNVIPIIFQAQGRDVDRSLYEHLPDGEIAAS